MKDDFDNWLASRRDDVPADDGELSPGTVIGGYRIVALLGRGGFADVYRAEGENGDAVAIKILYKLDDKSRARFVRESEILSQIKHRNVPRLLSFGSCGNRPYMVTELLRECELPSSDHRVAVFLRQIMSAVDELHRHGFIHRDIKPANILARADGTPVLIDFGLASPISAVQREADGLSVEDGRHIAVGTIGYAAPEQFNGLPAGREADIHAIGMLIKDCYQDKGKTPDCWRRIYLAAIASDPKSRYQTVQSLRRAVKRRHWRTALLLSSLVALLGVVAFLCVYIPTHALGYNSAAVSIKLSPENAPEENGQYSIRCKVIYKDRSVPFESSDGDCKIVHPTNKELLSLLEKFITDEYREGEYEDLLEGCRSGELADNIEEQFREFVCDYFSDMDSQVELGIDILDVEVKPEGALKKDVEKLKKDLEKEPAQSSME